MKKIAVILIFASAGLVWAGCSRSARPGPTNVAVASVDTESNKTNTSAEELGLLINLPYQSDEATWREISNQKKVIAVLRLAEPEAGKVIDDALKIGPPKNVTISPETWFPAELIAQSGMSAEDDLKGTAYAANAFFQPPYTDGRITRVENTDYFVLELYAK